MQILVERDTKTALSITSKISIDGKVMFYGLEPPSPLPAGEYECWLRWSAKNDKWVIAIMNVPGHTDIEAHVGNEPKDTKDCLLVGMERTIDTVLSSQVATGYLLRNVEACIPHERVTIKYVDAYQDAAHV